MLILKGWTKHPHHSYERHVHYDPKLHEAVTQLIHLTKNGGNAAGRNPAPGIGNPLTIPRSLASVVHGACSYLRSGGVRINSSVGIIN